MIRGKTHNTCCVTIQIVIDMQDYYWMVISLRIGKFKVFIVYFLLFFLACGLFALNPPVLCQNIIRWWVQLIKVFWDLVKYHFISYLSRFSMKYFQPYKKMRREDIKQFHHCVKKITNVLKFIFDKSGRDCLRLRSRNPTWTAATCAWPAWRGRCARWSRRWRR